jgi:hypothetical protein
MLAPRPIPKQMTLDSLVRRKLNILKYFLSIYLFDRNDADTCNC